jgi:DNA-binding transcriptional regulator YhcF (GntR family)
VFLTVDASDRRPIYQQVVDGVKALIASGDLREGTPLPTVRQVAQDLGVNLNTIAVAYRQLQEEGFLSVKHGSGTVVSFRPDRVTDADNALKTLRPALTELVLAGLSDRDIVRVVRDELQTVRLKGDRR